jgi:hypothetical protein
MHPDAGKIKMVAVHINVLEGRLEPGASQELFDSGYVNFGFGHAGGPWNPFAVSADGQRFLIPRPITMVDFDSPITVVLNWFRELQERVPVK